jgi:hypothetical protein
MDTVLAWFSSCRGTLVVEERNSDKLNKAIRVLQVFSSINDESFGQKLVGESVLTILHGQNGCQFYA